jgi:imidazolonepropionase-like amidohydrolase
MTDTESLADQTIVVHDGRIVAIGPRTATTVPPDAAVIDGSGSWVIPGLIDAHVHLHAGDLPAYRAAGITTVRNMWGTPGVAALQASAASGADVPTILSASPGVDGTPPSWPGTVIVLDALKARSEVRRLAGDGWTFIKVYNRLRPDVYAAVLDEARRVGVPVVGHVPFAVSIDAALDGGQASVEHLTGIAEAVAGGRGPAGWLTLNRQAVAPLAARVAASQTWVCPTLTVLRHLATNSLSPTAAAQARQHQLEVVRALHDAGVPLLAGTDAGIGLVAPGTSLLLELQAFVEAGLTPQAALRTATTDAARFLGVPDELGTVEVGKRADLVLLSRDPLADLSALASPTGLIQRGRRLY